MKDDKSLKSEKKLLDEEMKNWPEELEKEAAIVNNKYNLLEESKLNLINQEEILKYCADCTPWNDFVKEWMNDNN